MIDKFLEIFRKYADRTAFVIEEKDYSYSDLYNRISSISRVLKSNPDHEGKVIAIWACDHIDTYASIFAIWSRGYAYVPLDPDIPINRLEGIIKHLGVKTLLIPENDQNPFENIVEHVVKTSEIHSSESEIDIIDLTGNNLAYVLFTSGSTGKPKGVMITRNNLESYIRSFFNLGYRIDEHDRVLQMFSLGFDMSVMSFGMGLWRGAAIYTVPSVAMKNMTIIQMLEDHKITVALMTPSVIQSVSSWLDEINLPNLRYSIFAGEALSLNLMTAWKKSAQQSSVHNIYGPTEALGCFNYNCDSDIEKSKSHQGIISIGRPFRGMTAKLIDEKNNFLKTGLTGELVISGDQVMKGYWNNQEKTLEVLMKLNNDQKLYYKTGDLCFKDEDGDYYYVGRLDQQVKIDGFRVELQEIEYHLKKVQGVTNASVVFPESGKYANKIIAFMIYDKQDTELIKNILKEHLPDYMIPYHFVFPDEFPMNKNNKTDVQTLLALIYD